MKIQLVGKVTGLDRAECEDKFMQMERKLRIQGHDVVNPMRLVPADSNYEDAMRLCLRSLIEVDAIAVHKDWIDSKGARCEYLVACSLNLKVLRP